MLQYPIVQEIVQEAVAKAVAEAVAKAKAENMHEMILDFLEGRFGAIPPEMAEELRAITDKEKLHHLAKQAASCPDLNSWRTQLRP